MIGSLGKFDQWFTAPAAHRVHHSSALEHKDRNLEHSLFAGSSIWNLCRAGSRYQIWDCKPASACDGSGPLFGSLGT